MISYNKCHCLEDEGLDKALLVRQVIPYYSNPIEDAISPITSQR